MSHSFTVMKYFEFSSKKNLFVTSIAETKKVQKFWKFLEFYTDKVVRKRKKYLKSWIQFKLFSFLF